MTERTMTAPERVLIVWLVYFSSTLCATLRVLIESLYRYLTERHWKANVTFR